MKKCFSCGELTANPKFCSLSCANRVQRLNAPRKNRDRICPSCKETFQYNDDPAQKFCSHSCSATYSNKNRVRVTKLGTATNRKGKPCAYCGEPLMGTSAKYCSNVCSSQMMRDKNIQAWLEDPSTGNSQQGLKSSIRSYLIDEAGHKCSRCGWDKVHSVTGKVPLEVDHKDGDCYNNHPDNLRILCPSCHSLTATYGASNRNGQRAYRRRKNISLP